VAAARIEYPIAARPLQEACEEIVGWLAAEYVAAYATARSE
jgi:hypothetical protein